VATEGSVERALYEAGGSADSAAVLLGANWILRGRSNSLPNATEITFSLLRRGDSKTEWSNTYRLPSQSLSAAEDAVVKALLSRVLGDKASFPAAQTGRPTSAAVELSMAQGIYLLRDPSLAAADSARHLLERAFKSDTSSPALAVAMADAYLAVLERGGVNPSIARGAALRRVDELTKYALARDPRRGDAWTSRAVAARSRDTLAFAGALEAHGKALSLSPSSAEAIEQLAKTYAALGEDSKAANELQRALRVEPERGSALAALAEIELRAERFREACAYSNAAVAAAPFDAEAYAVRARARLHLGQARDAYADAETAALLSGEPWTEGLRLITQVGAGNGDGATELSRSLAQRYLAPGRTLSVNDASMLALGWIRLGDRRRGVDALSRARPRGKLLSTALRDRVFDSVREDSAFKALLTPASTTKRAEAKSASR
ncbi:MAG: tetratricopeptide repeat protein, partial [Gemmatimonadaceae bacterium]